MGADPLTPRQKRVIMIAAAVFGGMTVGLRERAWWVMPPVMFGTVIAFMLFDRTRPVTIWWVLLAAAVAIALGALLRYT